MFHRSDYLAIGVIFSSLVTSFVFVVKIVADDLGAESCRFRCATKECRSASTHLCFPPVSGYLPVDVTVQSSAYEIIFTAGSGKGSLETYKLKTKGDSTPSCGTSFLLLLNLE